MALSPRSARAPHAVTNAQIPFLFCGRVTATADATAPWGQRLRGPDGRSDVTGEEAPGGLHEPVTAAFPM